MESWTRTLRRQNSYLPHVMQKKSIMYRWEFGIVMRHCNSTTHKNFPKGLVHQPEVNMILPSRNHDDSVIRTEILMTNFIVQHNHLTKLFPKIFTDSKIVKKHEYARIKSICILTGAMMLQLNTNTFWTTFPITLIYTAL